MATITKFVTFYSYKGGVGRTSALINAAVMRALQGNRVLIVDFDLEAPGISPYLRKLDPAYQDHQLGLVEYLHDAIYTPDVPSLRERAIDLTACLRSTNGGTLWALGAGNAKDPHYTSKLERLKWREIFESQSGELLIKNMKAQIISEFKEPDYVFVDSRTGITETGGVCTRYLADSLVILSSLNVQNVQGTSLIHRDLQQDKPEIILAASNVPLGMPNGPSQVFSQRIQDWKDNFGRKPDLYIHYYPYLSLDELVFNSIPGASLDSHSETDPLYRSYTELADIIEQKNKDSFFKTLHRATWLLRSAALAHGTGAHIGSDEFVKIRQCFKDRPLAKLVLGLGDIVTMSLKEPDRPELWGAEDFKNLVAMANSMTNPIATEILYAARDATSAAMNRLVSKGLEITSDHEVYYHDHFLSGLIFEEIAKGHYAWPTSYLTRSLAENSSEASFPRAADLFNLAHCLMAQGHDAQARSVLKEFLEIFPESQKTSPGNAIPSQRANNNFCAGLASYWLGDDAAAIQYFELAKHDARLVPLGLEIFSPISFTGVDRKQFLREIARTETKLRHAQKRALSRRATTH